MISFQKLLWWLGCFAIAASTIEASGYSLVYHPKYGIPDPLPSDPMEDYWTVPLDDFWSDMVVIWLIDSSGNIVNTGPNSGLIVYAQSISKTVSDSAALNITINDTWTGSFCCHDHRMRPNYQRFLQFLPKDPFCFGAEDNFIYPYVQLYKGEAYFRRIMHMNQPFGDDLRFIQFYVTLDDGSKLHLDSPFFNVTGPETIADHLDFEVSPPTTVVANNPVSFQLKINSATTNVSAGGKVTDGHHSGLDVIFGVSNIHKWFHNSGGLRLESTAAEISGDEVFISRMDNDKRVIARAANGTVLISNVRIEDIAEWVTLNFTQIRHDFSYARIPEEEYYPPEDEYHAYNLHDREMKVLNGDSTQVTYSLSTYGKDFFRAVKLHNITVTEQTPDVLRLVPGYTLGGVFSANFPLVEPIYVELIDENGFRVTSGPNSELEVDTFVTNGDACLSEDSSFKLNRGIGVFPGSICEPILNVKLWFSVNSTAGPLTTEQTASFSVSGEIYIAEGSSTTAEKTFQEMAASHITASSTILPGRALLIAPSTGSGASKVQNAIDTAEARFPDDSKRVRGIVTTIKNNVDNIYPIGDGMGIPVVDFGSTDAMYADTVNFPLLARISFNDDFRFATLCSFFYKRNWKRVVVLSNQERLISASFRQFANVYGIEFKEVTFSDVTSAQPEESLINSVFAELDSFQTRLILSNLKGVNLQLMISEAVRRFRSPVDGYQWVGDDTFVLDFPLQNQGLCSVVSRSCVQSFKGSLTLSNSYATLSSPFWSIAMTAYGQVLSAEDYVSLGLAYDSVATLGQLFQSIINQQKTVTRSSVIAAFEGLSADYLTGPIELSADGERLYYRGLLNVFNPSAGQTGCQIIKKSKQLSLDPSLTVGAITQDDELLETMYQDGPVVYANMPAAYLIEYTVQSVDGAISPYTFTLTGGSNRVNFTESAPPDFYCTNTCGGTLLSPDDIHEWSHGTCIRQDVCQCHLDAITGSPAFAGLDCSVIVCDSCIYGTCTSPGVCTCEAGYTDSPTLNDCSVATCMAHGCNALYGNCTSADYCTCETGRYGKDCSSKCICENGICNDGANGNGECSFCFAGYGGATCALHLASVVTPTVLAGFLLIALAAFFGYRKYKHMQLMAALMSMDWKASWEEVRLRQKRQKSSMKSMMSMMSMMSAKSEKQQSRVVSENQADWNGKEIVIKQLRKESVELTDNIRWEIKQMKDMKHPNLCQFLGAVIESPHVAILNEVCGKGSLEDLLGNDDIDFGWDFRYSMLKDICRGLQYLHGSEIGSHGRLKSSNCLVDNRWTVKLSDFGMKEFKKNQQGVRIFAPNQGIGVELPSQEELEECDYYNLLWTAPEILHSGVAHLDHVEYGTKEGDVYSFSIVLVEMCTRAHPYAEIDYLGTDDLIQTIAGLHEIHPDLKLQSYSDEHGAEHTMLRPLVSETDLPSETDEAKGLKALMSDCWHEVPDFRPTSKDCMSRLNKISPHKGELMDNLITLMEQYTVNLESIVAERTKDLVGEKEKSDNLLMTMLPPIIAEELKLGNKPAPEFFTQVTIFFSDVVGFSQICAAATPYEVVDLLNDLYSVMDAVIDGFDVYKVETIGDVYMVVSGLPIRNGDNHAGEIATMTLHLLSAMTNLGYRHLPDSQIQLRVGIHSGPCVAGVVGLQNPRYCLFGDTVNTSARMQTASLALKVHLSEDAYNVLSKLGGYQFESRGERQVKGRGTMTTYWLKGKDGLELEFPPDHLALSESQHYFK